MTINKISIVFEDTNLKCDLCDSDDIVDEREGYVCRNCGVVLTVQKLQYDRPYNNDTLHHSIKRGSTQIGTIRERTVHPHSHQLRRMSKYNSQLSNKEQAEIRASREVSRIFECLSLPRACEDRVKTKFAEIFPQLSPGSKHKNPEKLAAILIYLVLKLENIAIKREDLIQNSQLSKEEFNNFILQLRQYLPQYSRRNRQGYIAQKIMEITEHFELDMSFYFLSRKILSKLWESIKNTTDDVIAGLCTSITTLCSYRDVITVGSICNLLDIRMSTVQFQVKKRIFERFRLPGFISLVRSSGLLKRFMEKVGLLEGEPLEVEFIQEEPDHPEENVVSIKLGSGRHIFNRYNDHYLIGSVGDNKTITLCYLEVYGHHKYRGRKSTKRVRSNKGVLFDLTSGEYYHKKDPPLVNYT
jgi:transcription initiation factor TFIIIB Brf1 subunit/transcription initiation factor TFIIB